MSTDQTTPDRVAAEPDRLGEGFESPYVRSAIADGVFTLLGLDGEMSGADLEDGCRLIQIGVSAWTAEPGGEVDTFSSLIGYPVDYWTEDTWQAKAESVHGFTREQVAAAPAPAEVDDALYEWLLTHGAVAGRRMLVPIGLNVGAFDMPFVRDALPRSASLFARRCTDLNALLFTFDGWDPIAGQPVRDFAGWKRSMRVAANTTLAADPSLAGREHDAGFDAAQALVGWWWLRSQFAPLPQKVATLTAQLEEADPLRRTVSPGLMRRLQEFGAARAEIELLAARVAAAYPGVQVSTWFGRPDRVLQAVPMRYATEHGFPALLAACAALSTNLSTHPSADPGATLGVTGAGSSAVGEA